MEKTLKIHFDMYTADSSNNYKWDNVDMITINNILYAGEYSYNNEPVMNISNIVEESVDLNAAKTYYRYPKLNLSRDKMLNLREKYDIKKVLDVTKADVRIISQKTINTYTTSAYNCSLSSPAKLKVAMLKFRAAFSDEVFEHVMESIKDLSDNHPVLLYANQRYTYGVSHNSPSYDFCNQFRTSAYCFVPEESIDAWNSIVDLTSPIVTDEYMNQIASEDSIIIDSEQYKNIEQMFNSNSKEDHNVAMTIMANCNIEESKTYLALLFFHMTDTMRAAPVWSQVAFKSIKEKFIKYEPSGNYYNTYRYTSIIRQLAEDDALTLEAANHIIDLTFNAVLNENARFNTENSVFELDRADVRLTADVQKKIKDNKTLSDIILSNDESITHKLPF